MHSCVVSSRLKHLSFPPEKGSHFSICCYTRILRNTNQEASGYQPYREENEGEGLIGVSRPWDATKETTMQQLYTI